MTSLSKDDERVTIYSNHAEDPVFVFSKLFGLQLGNASEFLSYLWYLRHIEPVSEA